MPLGLPAGTTRPCVRQAHSISSTGMPAIARGNRSLPVTRLTGIACSATSSYTLRSLIRSSAATSLVVRNSGIGAVMHQLSAHAYGGRQELFTLEVPLGPVGDDGDQSAGCSRGDLAHACAFVVAAVCC